MFYFYNNFQRQVWISEGGKFKVIESALKIDKIIFFTSMTIFLYYVSLTKVIESFRFHTCHRKFTDKLK